jgi:Tol biopolymer transport system component/tetratricopeptide (TPR) repeat protein
MSKQSIYAVGGTVQASGGIYISRDADEELLRLCRAGEFCYVLTAHQTGKSSLKVATMERLAAEGFRSVEIDLSRIGTGSLELTAEQWYLGLIDLIVDQLNLDVDPVAWWDERALLGPTQQLSQFLRQVVLEQISKPVVIFVDEIGSTFDLDFTDDFFAAIRACYNARASEPAFKRLSFVLLGVANPSDLISDPQRTPFNMGRRVDLADFTHRQAVPLADGLGLPPVEAGQVLTWILDWTGGHPYLTQHLCAEAAASPTKNWDAAAVDRLVEKTFLGEQSAQDSNLQFVRDMLTQRAPNKAAVLKTYRRIHAGQAVTDEERSPVKTHLKLSGVAKQKGDHLVVRNRIYEQVFNQEWIGQNMPRDWTRWIAVISTILVLLGSLFGYCTYRQGQQTTEARAQAFIDKFRGAISTDVRITSLADLLKLPGYEDRARKLFYEELTREERQVLFAWADPQAVGAQLVVVIKGVYMDLENNDRDNRLLEVMAQSLRELDDPMAVNLTTEIEQWIQGREAYAEGQYEQAVIAYSVAVSLNDANPATHFDRAIAYASLGRYEEALADFEKTLQLDEKRASIVDEEIRSRGVLHNRLAASQTRYPTLAAVVPTPAPTLTFTPKPTPTFAFTPTPTDTSSPVSTPTDTPAAVVVPTLADTATPTPPILVGKIAFPVFDPTRGAYDIFIANADGTGREKFREEASQPCFSPDGSEITYRSWRSDKRGLIVAHPFGDDIWTISTRYEASRPSVSKRGTLYHCREAPHTLGHIHLMDDSGEPKVITWGDQRQPIFGESPAWVPGERLVYKGSVGATYGLYLTDGLYEKTGITQLTSHLSDTNPEASPDGKKIAFMSHRDGNWEIYVMDLDNGTAKRLTNNGANDGLPVWSPAGRTIAFASDRGGEWAIWAMNPDGSNQQMLFPLGGSLHGYVRDAPLHERGGWEEERLSWSP